MNRLESNVDFIIAIDFGCATTSAACFCCRSRYVFPLELGMYSKDIPTVVSIFDDEKGTQVHIGENALRKAEKDYANKLSYAFQNRPSMMNDEEVKCITLYMKAVYDEILMKYPDFQGNNHSVILSCPDYDECYENESRIFLQFAKNAGLPIIDVETKSKSIFCRAYDICNKYENVLLNDMLIINCGYEGINTISYHADKRTLTSNDFTLGACEIDYFLLKYFLGNLSNAFSSDCYISDMDFFGNEEKKTYMSKILLNRLKIARKGYFLGATTHFEMGFSTGFRGQNGKRIYGDMIVEKEKFMELTNNYFCRLREIFRNIESKKIDYIFVTGSESFMLHDIIKDEFSHNSGKVFFDLEPGSAVSLGLANMIDLKVTNNSLIDAGILR